MAVINSVIRLTHRNAYRVSSFLSSPILSSSAPIQSFSTMNGHTDDLQKARAKVADEVKFNILTATQEVDNEATFKSVQRNFLCEYWPPSRTRNTVC